MPVLSGIGFSPTLKLILHKQDNRWTFQTTLYHNLNSHGCEMDDTYISLADKGQGKGTTHVHTKLYLSG